MQHYLSFQDPSRAFERLPLLPADNGGTLMACTLGIVEGKSGIMCAGTIAMAGDPKQVMFMPLDAEVNVSR